MQILLDTHALLWLISDDNRLSEKARSTFLDQKNKLFFSAAGFWEISIKVSIGKLKLKKNWIKILEEELAANAIHWLPIEIQHCARLIKLPFHHRDPFDRMIIAQALVENMRVLSCDEQLSAYNITRIW